MKNIFKISGVLLLAAALMAPALTSCDNDDFNTNQYVGGVHLNVFGPSPVARGGQLRFIGSGMNQITKIAIPGCEDITDIEVINDGEIRITVPQTAEPGKVVLTYAGGTITTKTDLTFLEPISLDAATPLTVKPGQELTLTGEYLNLINEVCFTFINDSVNVYAEDFTAHSRKEIKVVVPAEAVTGPIAISDAKEMPNVIVSEFDVTIVTPSIETPLDLSGHKGGDVITIKGKDFDLITKIEVPEEQFVDFTYNAEDGSITFTLPENVADGPVVAITAGDAHVAIANIGVVVPTEMVATPATGLRGGDIVTVNGLNMDQVVSLVFPGIEGPTEPEEVDGTHVKFTWPDAAQSGEITFNLKSGKTVVCAVETAKPEATGYNPEQPNLAAEMKIIGKNLDLVSSITFGGGAEVAADAFAAQSANEITLTVPSTAEAGALTLHMANGESVEAPALGVQLPVCAYVVECLTEEPMGGDVMIFTIANEDKLTGVQVNGKDVQYILNGTRLIVQLPQMAGKGSKVTLISSNGEISYTYDVTPATHIENVIMNTPHDLGSWTGEDAGGAFRLYKQDFEGVPAGAKLVFSVAPYKWAQVQLNDANWGQMDMVVVEDINQTSFEWELTAERLERILTTSDGWSETALVIQGEGLVVNRVSIAYEMSLEVTIWTGPWTCAGWGGNQDLAWGGYDWSSVKAGTVLRAYCTPTVADGDWWCISFRHGDNWANLPEIPSQIDTPEGGIAEFVLTQTIIDDLVANGGMVITGDGFILDKITLE